MSYRSLRITRRTYVVAASDSESASFYLVAGHFCFAACAFSPSVWWAMSGALRLDLSKLKDGKRRRLFHACKTCGLVFGEARAERAARAHRWWEAMGTLRRGMRALRDAFAEVAIPLRQAASAFAAFGKAYGKAWRKGKNKGGSE